jgi:broad specificity phosphatase PhoE
MPAILLVRHGQASYGAADYDLLSDHGHAQAKLLTAELHRQAVKPARVAAGSLQRQLQTAQPVASAAEVQVTIDAGFDEYDTSDVLASHSGSDVRASSGGGSPTISSDAFQQLLDPAVERWIAAGTGSAASESWTAFSSRAQNALVAFAALLKSGETGLVATSGGVIAALCVRLLGLPDGAFVALNRVAVNGALTKILIGRRGLSLISYNEHGYLITRQRSLVTYR